MDPISAALGVASVIPDCIRIAKDLFDLRSRYKDASMLITAIYTESMVISASLSQIRMLIERGAFNDKPELFTTFDTALTGCRVVYSCLNEEVEELGRKANADDLCRKDRFKYLWKEGTMKELLQQIRGQQSALTLLIQGLQMESLSDIKRLVEDNSAALNRVATRSQSLRLKHPSVKVAESILDGSTMKDISDGQSTLSEAEFDFDDEIVNSKAYRRVLARANTRASSKKPEKIEIEEGDLIDLNDYEDNDEEEGQVLSAALEDLKSLDFGRDSTSMSVDIVDDDESEGQADYLDELEKSMLPFMPPLSTQVTGTQAPLRSDAGESSLNELSTSQSALISRTFGPPDHEVVEEKPPALPPRRSVADLGRAGSPRTTSPTAAPSDARLSAMLDDSASSFSISTPVSDVSTTSSRTFSEPAVSEVPRNAQVQRKPLPKLPLQSKASLDIFQNLSAEPENLNLNPFDDVRSHDIWIQLSKDEEAFTQRLVFFRIAFYDAVISK